MAGSKLEGLSILIVEDELFGRSELGSEFQAARSNCFPVQSIIERQADPEAPEDRSMMEALIRASKRGDREASDLLVFGYLEELGRMSPLEPSSGSGRPEVPEA